MWCPDCGTEMRLPENICPACHKQVPLGSGEFLPQIPADVPDTSEPLENQETIETPCAAEDTPSAVNGSFLGFRNFFGQCQAELTSIFHRLTRKDDSDL